MNLAKQIKHALFVLCGFLLVFTLLYLCFKGQSGGDITLALFSIIFLIVYTLVIGLITYSWKLKAKFGLIAGLLLSYGVASILLN
ncbi:MAG: hypothetical protein EP338_03120 [Bacteroidetes bacterium]|nr:MAG: hypothetical protein EP338_03120 [Bacteroidota bacterium]